MVLLQLTGNTVRLLQKYSFFYRRPKASPLKPNKKNNMGLSADEFYYTPEGFIVFTEAYHLKRGYCCKNGCRHCPYGFKKKEE
jgi:hypothetical protein